MSDRRRFLTRMGMWLGSAALVPFSIRVRAAPNRKSQAPNGTKAENENRFPYFHSTPVSYLNVKLSDAFWAPRQKTTHDVSLNWITKAHDKAGGLEAFRKDSAHYVTKIVAQELEHIKFLESMATVLGVGNDEAVAGLIDSWAKPTLDAQSPDGYLAESFPTGPAHPGKRWDTVRWSHEDYYIGNYIEAAIAYREVTGNETLYNSALRAADNMVSELLDGHHAYTSGHPEIEQALMRLYEVSGNTDYVRLCGWLLDQRGHHDGRPSYGRAHQDDIPVRDQRTIEGHAVRAGFLFNGVTEYVGATGDAGYREAVLSVWDNFVNCKMYLHGAGGNQSSRNEGYRTNPYCILPDDAYGESCSIFANFQWAHNMFRLTSDARYLDVAERMLYNAFYASLSLRGDSSFYCNLTQTPVFSSAPRFGQRIAIARSPDLATSCCPPNIVKLFNKIGGFLYSTDSEGVYIKHYCASESNIPWNGGVLTLKQETNYPWDGAVRIAVAPGSPEVFSLRLRVPAWARSYEIRVNGQKHETTPRLGWVVLRRRWNFGDQVELSVPMPIERTTMPAEFAAYRNLMALQRGPIVYCLEEQDVKNAANPWPGFLLGTLFIPEGVEFHAEHRPELLGGVTVLIGSAQQVDEQDAQRAVSITLVPYGVWGNRSLGEMRIWLAAGKASFRELVHPTEENGDSCVG